jgi:hypothetical protein
METENDKALWKTAKKRVAFKKQLAVYLIVNASFWLYWIFSENTHNRQSYVPWPVWPMIGWGIGLAFSYYNAYGAGQTNSVEKEYQKLKQKQGEG